MQTQKLVSWNVNGIRAVLKKDFAKSILSLAPDVFCLQEIKARPEQVESDDLAAFEPYEAIWNPADRPGYSGTAVFTRVKPADVRLGIGMKEHDAEGRVITCEFPEYFLVNVYTPNAGEELKRLPYRLQWEKDFRAYLKGLEKKKPVVLCGDLNVAHKEIDLEHPAANRGNSGFTDEERAEFTKLLESGFLDTFREIDQSPKKYTWWTYRMGARSRNVGWRIDYFCISKDLRPAMKTATIHPDLLGSDHCPVGLELK
ncbi:MAG TPA: exodeoxyribonuclease III [bacterium]|nr:exodeoxyribonuclease III [bacterium]